MVGIAEPHPIGVLGVILASPVEIGANLAKVSEVDQLASVMEIVVLHSRGSLKAGTSGRLLSIYSEFLRSCWMLRNLDEGRCATANVARRGALK